MAGRSRMSPMSRMMDETCSVGHEAMDELPEQIARSAERAVAMSRDRGTVLDYAEASLGIVEAMLEEAAACADEFAEEERASLVHHFGCYILEVARRNHGGVYYWFEERDQ